MLFNYLDDFCIIYLNNILIYFNNVLKHKHYIKQRPGTRQSAQERAQ
jgi:hypothetical protein